MAKYEAEIEISKEINAVFPTPLFTGDIGNTVKLNFFHRCRPYCAEGAEVFCKRSDGTVVSIAAIMQKNVLEFTIPNNMYPGPGELELQITLTNGDGAVLTSGVLHFEVLEGWSEQSAITGTDQYHDMTALLAETGQLLEHAKTVIDQCVSATEEAERLEELFQPITEADAEGLESGYAIVTGSKTTDSEGGPILTEYRYPLAAGREDTFGSVTVWQVRLYGGELQKRTLGGEWKKLENGLIYKGSLENTEQLPSSPSSGEMYNIETESEITVKGREKTVYLIPIFTEIDDLRELNASYDTKYDSWLNNPSDVELFDTDGKSMGTYMALFCVDGALLIQGSGLDEGTTVGYFQLPNRSGDGQGESVTVCGEETIAVMPKQKVFYNGTEWDVFCNFGDVESALTKIDALQNRYIGETGV